MPGRDAYLDGLLGRKLVNARQPPAPLADFAATSPKMERAPPAGQEAEARTGKAETGSGRLTRA